VSARRRVFVLAAAALLSWTALLETTLDGRPSHGGAARPPTRRHDDGAPATGPAVPSPPDLRPPPRPTGPVANDAADPAAAGPTAGADPVVAALVRRWCAVYLRLGVDPRAAATLRSLSTPAAASALTAPPIRPPGHPAPMSLVRLQLFRTPSGRSAIVDLHGDGSDVLLELILTATPAGPRVSAVYR
jgi:hypothetical protein